MIKIPKNENLQKSIRKGIRLRMDLHLLGTTCLIVPAMTKSVIKDSSYAKRAHYFKLNNWICSQHFQSFCE